MLNSRCGERSKYPTSTKLADRLTVLGCFMASHWLGWLAGRHKYSSSSDRGTGIPSARVRCWRLGGWRREDDCGSRGPLALAELAWLIAQYRSGRLVFGATGGAPARRVAEATPQRYRDSHDSAGYRRMVSFSSRAGEASLRISHSTGSDGDLVLESGGAVVMKLLKSRYCLLLVVLVSLVALAWPFPIRTPVDQSESARKPTLAQSGRFSGREVSFGAPPANRPDAPPGGRLTSVKVTISGTREDYVTDMPLKDIGMFYLELMPRSGRLVRAITGGRLLWFAEFEEPTGTTVFITVRTLAIDAVTRVGTDNTKVSIVRIKWKAK